MSKFTSIEIASIVSLHPKVEAHRYLGLFESARYKPTHSSIQSYRNYYNADEANQLLDIAAGTDAPTSLKDMAEMNTSENGNYRLDICMSEDCQFVAFQIFERKQDNFEPCSKLCILEGNQAKAFENLLA